MRNTRTRPLYVRVSPEDSLWKEPLGEPVSPFAKGKRRAQARCAFLSLSHQVGRGFSYYQLFPHIIPHHSCCNKFLKFVKFVNNVLTLKLRTCELIHMLTLAFAALGCAFHGLRLSRIPMALACREVSESRRASSPRVAPPWRKQGTSRWCNCCAGPLGGLRLGAKPGLTLARALKDLGVE